VTGGARDRLRLLAATLSAAACVALVSGCADLPAARVPADDRLRAGEGPVEPKPLSAAAQQRIEVLLEIDAPAPLRELLQRNLDLARLVALNDDEARDETEWLRLVGAAPAQARELLQTEGYFAASVQVQRDPSPPGKVLVKVTPGPRTRVRSLALNVQGPLQQFAAAGDGDARAQIDALRSAWPMGRGAFFRNADWSNAKSGAVAQLRALGYARAAVTASAADVDVASAEVTLALTVDSGPRFLAGGLHIDGLQRHDEDVVRNMSGFGPGQPLTEVLLLDYQDRLRKSGLFDSAVVTFDADPASPEAVLVSVQLHELPIQSATIGVGVSANTGPRTSLEYTHRRIFGYPATAHNKLEYGRDRQAWEGEISSHPGERFYRNLLGWQIERLETDVDVVLSQRLRLGRTQDTPRIERLYFVGLDRSVQTTAAGIRRDAQALSLQYHGVWRNLDSVILPTRGVSLSAQGGVGWAQSNYAESGAFTRAYGRLTGYLPLGSSWYSTARLELGQVFKRDTVALPDALAFRAGGDDSVRGYPYRSLAPTDANGVISGGNMLGTASVELARPFTDRLPSLWGAVFVDAGRAANSWSGFKPALGYGVGLRWRSPVGPLRLDWAYGEELHKARLHLSVGIAF
jgi:translocation and assembly module TamA